MDKLTELADYYQTDKGSSFFHKHEFSKVYFEIFNGVRESVQSILEIGILNGASIRMWREFFPNAVIYGFDNDSSKLGLVKDLPNVFTYLVDQSDRDSLLTARRQTGRDQFDIIIDDGSHMMNHQQLTFGTLFPYVKPGGKFIIEDIHTSLNADIIAKEGFNTTTLHMFKEYEDTNTIKSIHMTDSELQYINDNILSADVFGRENVNSRPSKMSITSIITKK